MEIANINPQGQHRVSIVSSICKLNWNLEIFLAGEGGGGGGTWSEDKNEQQKISLHMTLSPGLLFILFFKLKFCHLMITLCASRKYPYPHHRGSLEIPRRRGS